ncbi:MAG: carboxylating nicotinate-nucleotide diphosphorylase [Leptolyngbya sp. PLA3]|nr:MAG: carboxylating nicotinate-nucleotide diphosphorylase [Cyanobacteria bacterium CYA]MCE7969471.1 carboxylating nicotinate-nucleotide diphosphorylase [Leptolyngbya sp. PL-A3]
MMQSAAMYEQIRSTGLVRRLLELARDEDLGPAHRDLTSELFCEGGATVRCAVVARHDCVVCGLGAGADVIEVFGCQDDVHWTAMARDGDSVRRGEHVALIEGLRRGVLGVERTLLNLVGRLSGVATQTSRYLDAMGPGVRSVLCDTRKTTPGMRVLEKYAVVCGGGVSHRMGLYDAVLVKDNHLAGVPLEALAERIEQMARRARAEPGCAFVEVEVDGPAQFERLCEVGPGLVQIALLDNFAVADLRAAVEMRDRRCPGLLIEASGGVKLQTIRAVAQTGVDRISVGALTHSAVSADFGLDAL